MSDSQPPVWGSAPWDERHPGPTLPDAALADWPPRPGDDVPTADLLADEAVLSGTASGSPRTAEAVIAALLAPGRPDELDGEAAALASFRMLTHPGQHPDSTLSGPIPVRPVLLRRADGGSHRRRSRGHRRPDRAPWSGRRLTAVLAGAAAGVAGVIAVSFALTGTGPAPAVVGRAVPATHAVAPGSPAPKQQSVDGGATKVPTPKPTPSVTAPSAAQLEQLCVTYAQGRGAGRESWSSAAAQLSMAADGKWKVSDYCASLFTSQAGWAGSGDQQPDQQGADNGHGGLGGDGPAGRGNGPGDGGNGKGGAKGRH